MASMLMELPLFLGEVGKCWCGMPQHTHGMPLAPIHRHLRRQAWSQGRQVWWQMKARRNRPSVHIWKPATILSSLLLNLLGALEPMPESSCRSLVAAWKTVIQSPYLTSIWSRGSQRQHTCHPRDIWPWPSLGAFLSYLDCRLSVSVW